MENLEITLHVRLANFCRPRSGKEEAKICK